jgi:hypothetical protein
MVRGPVSPPGGITSLAALAVLALPSAGAIASHASPGHSGRSAAMLRYEVDLSESHAHRVRVRMSVLDASGDGVALAMPVWTPGSYMVREFARHVVDLVATDDAGRALEVRKVDKNTWRVDTGGGRVVHAVVLHHNILFRCLCCNFLV